MKKILYIATGGTIASINKGTGLEPGLNTSDVLNYCPDIKGLCEIDSVQPINLDSTNIRPGHWIILANTISKNYNNYDGFVISHGTDTMSYTAAALSYLIQDNRKPIVITGAQKPINEIGSDAIKNITDAFVYACDDDSVGVQIVFFGSVIAGTRARKNYSKSYSAFGSINFPELARVNDKKIVRYITEEKPTQVKFYDFLNPNVGLIKFTPGMSVDVLSYIIDQYDGLIIESYGLGGLPEYSDFYEEIKRATNIGKIIVMTTQVANEGSNMSVYKVGTSVKGSLNILEAYDLTSEAALTKLMWCLGQSNKFEGISKMFYKTIGHDMLLNK